MTVSVPLTREQEAKLNTIARDRGMSPDALVKAVVQDILERGMFVSKGGELRSEERQKQLEELFDTFDSLNVQPGVKEEAFHRENWYR
ncbi:MAG: hypothetical protein HY013_20905 [Candidatus Solibacter usitatus]|nr:hypothetical protein [Candidatus Solibacter usitatus]